MSYILAFLLGLPIVFWQPHKISTASMKPTLLVGDNFAVSRTARTPDYGDVIAFRHPVSGAGYVKRVVGLPGDDVQMKGGVLYINGVAAAQEPNGKFVERYSQQGPLQVMPLCENRPVPMGGDCEKSLFVETLPNGRSHPVLNIRDGFGDDTDVYSVPEGHVFVMGDHRDNSLDSRMPTATGGIGFVPVENLIGEVDFVILSSAGRSMLNPANWRAGRFLVILE